jgi:hypothetical protein
MADPAASRDAARPPAPAPALPPDLEARLAAFESAPAPGDFDAASWFWIILLGVAIPLGLLILGWRA